jgi:CheY-like chemotaxis protein/predicted regulator of Ras-like GTPase activity (Roadblock/LC7/MglB family)
MRVLIVDDEASVRLAIERRLRAQNIATLQASSVKQAIDRLRAEPFDAVLCDLRMPGGDGSELVAWLSSYSPSTRIVVMSAYVTDEFRRTFGSAPGLTILEKPLELEQLVAMLEQFGPRRGFYGNAIELELFDYVQMIALSGRDKLVEVETPQAVGRIWFEHGDIVHVEYRDFRGELAFYKLLGSGRGTFREVFNSPPPKVSVLRSSTHLLMEAARLADEGLLEDDDPIPVQAPKPSEEGFDETSFEELNTELAVGVEAANRSAFEDGAVAEADQDSTPVPKPQPPVIDPSESSPLPILPEFENPEDIFAPLETTAATNGTATIGDDVSFDEDDLAVLDALTEIDEDNPTEEFVTPAPQSVMPASEPAGGETVTDAPQDAIEASSASEIAIAEPAPPPAATASGAAPTSEEQTAAYASGASHAIFEDPDMRNVMLEQFWQFEGVNGVAIISSTGKVLAEDMRSNSSLVTLAGFYMRGAARIARTLGHNVFDGVVARSVNGQQMVMVSMGAASAVLSVEPGIDPEAVRDAVMGVE